MANSSSVRKSLADFQECVRALSESVNSASVDWQDEVYASLQSSISQVATASRAVMNAGTQACSSLARIESILEEE